jgi:hypothetical protein
MGRRFFFPVRRQIAPKLGGTKWRFSRCAERMYHVPIMAPMRLARGSRSAAPSAGLTGARLRP